MRIHVVLCPYSTGFGITRAFESLNRCGSSMVDITMLRSDRQPYIDIDPSGPLGRAGWPRTTVSTLSEALNGREYGDDDVHLFLYDHDYLSGDLGALRLDLAQTYRVIASPYSVASESFARPFLIHSKSLSERWGNLDSLLAMDPEAAIVAVMQRFPADQVTTLSLPAVKQTRKLNDRFRAEYLRSLAGQIPAPASGASVPSIAVILANYNMARYLPMALASLGSQSVPASEIWLVDDGSTDASPTILQEWANQHGAGFFGGGGNEGKARRLNAALPQMQADFVLELDADDWIDPNAVATIQSCLAALPAEANLLYGNLRTWREGLHLSLIHI